ncbi:MAG: DUF2357 domain-containing protein, partial [Myxococcales bacterium]|nr:DUF2357 domain-containing protein [Myxococcales bacterium]
MVIRCRLQERGEPTGVTRLCDSVVVDGLRVGDELPAVGQDAVLGRWPADLECNAFEQLAVAVGERPTWQTLAAKPAVAQRLGERARPQPLDREILRHLRHLQQVCQTPRMHLRVEEERLPVGRARRTPMRAVADLVAHPENWEHRSLRSISPSRVLARQVEDDFDLYENRVAARLVDHLLTYLAQRLEELNRIGAILNISRDHGEHMRATSPWRARRIGQLWSTTLEDNTADELRETLGALDRAQRSLQQLLDSQLYRNVPRRHSVAVSLNPTNILINDQHYRKVALLWRVWAQFGHRRPETQL